MKRFILPFLSLFGAGCTTPAASAPNGPARVEVSVTADGFHIAHAPVLKAGQPVTLVVTRKVEKTCATDIVLKDYGISQPLPLNQPVEVVVTPTKPGTLHFACAMDMVMGDLEVK